MNYFLSLCCHYIVNKYYQKWQRRYAENGRTFRYAFGCRLLGVDTSKRRHTV